MFFVRQRSNKCGLHAIQNMFESAAVTEDDLSGACRAIQEKTGDPVHNHETFGGDWSCSAVLQASRNRGYEVRRAVNSGHERAWSSPDIETLMEDDAFRGIILYQPRQRHFTCARPQDVDGTRSLYYVDSQADGPVKMSPKLLARRCVGAAYAWEPFLVHGDKMPHAPPKEDVVAVVEQMSAKRRKFTPSNTFMQDWYATSKTKTQTPTKTAPHAPALAALAERDTTDT